MNTNDPADYPFDGRFSPPTPPPPPAYPYGAAYVPAYDPYRQIRPLGTSGMAVAALIVSLVSLALCGSTSIIGLILGIVAMRDTKRSGQDGYGMALAAVIVSAVPLVLWALYWLFVVVIFAGSAAA